MLRKGSKGVAKDISGALRLVSRISGDYPRSKEDLAWLTAKTQNAAVKYPIEVYHILREGA